MRSLLVSLLVLGMLLFSGARGASAWYYVDDFSENTEWWIDFEHSDPEGTAENISVTRDNGRLEFSAGSVPSGDFGIKGKMFNTAFSVNSDFEFQTDLFYSQTTNTGGVTGVLFFWSGQPGAAPELAKFFAGMGTDNGSKWFSFGKVDEEEGEDNFARTADGATLWGQYTAAGNGHFDFVFKDSMGTPLASSILGDIKTDFPSISTFSLGIGGFSEGAVFTGDQAYADNFAATPEPVSSVLFLIGAASMAVLRHRRRNGGKVRNATS